MISRFLDRRYPLILLFLLILFYAINNYIWLNLNEFPPFAGEAYHLLKGLDHLNILTHPHKHMFPALIKISNYRPPLFPISMAVSNIIWGNSRVVSTMTNIFFAGILFFSLYFMGKKMQDRNAGLLAAFIVAMYPFVFGLSRMARDNFASMALVCLSLSCLVYTEGLKRFFPVILLGLFLGLGVLTRFTFIFFVIGPIIITAAIAILNKTSSVTSRKNIILNLSLATVIAILLGSIWFLPNFSLMLKNYLEFLYLPKYPVSLAPKLFSLESFTFYLKGLINGQISPLFVILFLIGLITILKKGKSNPLFFSWVVVTYIIFSLIMNKEVRETSEYLPAFALTTSMGILSIEKQWLKRCLIYIIIFGGLAQYFIVSYTTPSSAGIKLSFFKAGTREGLAGPSYLHPINEVFFYYPRKGDWQISKIISVIQKESSVYGNDATIGVTDAYIEIKTDWYDNSKVGSWHENFVAANVNAINYFLRVNGLFYKVIGLSRHAEGWRESPSLDFIISVNKIEILAPLIFREYKLILQANVPDGSPIYVYKRVTAE